MPDAEGRVRGAKTCCVVVADRAMAWWTRFGFFFYAYNYGGTVLSMNLGIVSLLACACMCSQSPTRRPRR